MSATPIGPGALVGGDFQLLRLIASGGMGAVYLAEQRSTGAMRAVKVLHARFAADPRTRERFVDEARVGVRIESDHLVEVVAAGFDANSGIPWIAMELLDGMTLGAAVEQRGCIPGDEAWEVFRQLGHALSAAHAAGVVHRDLKPENIILAASRRAGVPFTVKVLDFGIAKLLAERAASNTQALGSPRWMAPEQLQPGAPIGPSTDVWSLGLLAYFTLSGAHYWRRADVDGNAMGLVVEIASDPLVPASERAASQQRADRLPQGFDAWFARCVTRRQSDRFADGAQATSALLSLLRAPRVAPTVATPSQPMTPYVPATTASAVAPLLVAPQTVSAPQPVGVSWVPAVQSPPMVPWGMPPAATPPPVSQPSSRGRSVGLAVGGTLAALGLAVAGLGIGISIFRDDEPRSEAPPPPQQPQPETRRPGPPMPDASFAPVAAQTVTMPFAAGQRWVGSYVCAQGRTELTLRISSVAGDYVTALFEFRYAPTSTSGVCTMNGGYLRASRRLPLRPVAWVQRPAGYIAVPMDGFVSDDGSTYAGRMQHPSCGEFSLRLSP